tara:strand:- start:34 stop:285 length:252 start_codon:yes stop_codon:yes gene_type:complete
VRLVLLTSDSENRVTTNDYQNSERVKMEKKKLLLRIDPKLHDELRKWADDDFRSINSQIEFLLRKAILENRKVNTEDNAKDKR